MKWNARPRPRRHNFAQELAFEDHTRHIPRSTRVNLFAWLHRWRRRPDRIFWHLDPTTGHWHRL